MSGALNLMVGRTLAAAMPSYLAAGTGVSIDSDTGNVDYPSSVSSGGALLLHTMVAESEEDGFSTTGINTPSGWTRIGGTYTGAGIAPNRARYHSVVIAKTSTGSESGSLSIDSATGWGVIRSSRMYSFTGGGSNEGAAASGLAAPSTTLTVTGCTTTGSNRLVCAFISTINNTTTGNMSGETGGDYTEAVAEYSAANGTIQLQTAQMASSGTISGGSVTFGSSSNHRHGIVVAIYD